MLTLDRVRRLCPVRQSLSSTAPRLSDNQILHSQRNYLENHGVIVAVVSAICEFCGIAIRRSDLTQVTALR